MVNVGKYTSPMDPMGNRFKRYPNRLSFNDPMDRSRPIRGPRGLPWRDLRLGEVKVPSALQDLPQEKSGSGILKFTLW